MALLLLLSFPAVLIGACLSTGRALFHDIFDAVVTGLHRINLELAAFDFKHIGQRLHAYASVATFAGIPFDLHNAPPSGFC
jgi:hypothetical protein